MSAGYRVPAIVAASAILREVSSNGSAGLRAAQLADATGLARSTAHNVLATLVEEGLLQRDADSRVYRLGPALVPLGAAAARQMRAVPLSIERLAPLAASHELSFAVAQCVGADEVQIVERLYPPHGIHVGITLGSRYRPPEGALGKLLLAAMPDEDLAAVLAGPIPSYTPQSITEPSLLREEIEEIRTRGWASSIRELNENNAVAATVHGAAGEPALMLLALGFPGELPDDDVPRIGALLADLAAGITRDTGGIAPALAPTHHPTAVRETAKEQSA